MPKVLTTASDVNCGHPAPPPGRVQAVGADRLLVEGSPVLLKEGVEGKSISGCKTPVTTDSTDTLSSPCVKVESVSAGEASKLLVDGKPVLTEDLKGVTGDATTKTGLIAKTPSAALKGLAGQTKLETT